MADNTIQKRIRIDEGSEKLLAEVVPLIARTKVGMYREADFLRWCIAFGLFAARESLNRGPTLDVACLEDAVREAWDTRRDWMLVDLEKVAVILKSDERYDPSIPEEVERYHRNLGRNAARILEAL